MSDAVRLVPHQQGAETKNERFKRIAEKRMRKLLDGLDRLGSLAGPNYAYSEDEAQQIAAALRQKLDELERCLGCVTPSYRLSSP